MSGLNIHLPGSSGRSRASPRHGSSGRNPLSRRLRRQAMPPPDKLLEEIFLRLPPDEPECLVRASLASKLWLGRLSDPRFRARYSDLHGAPPMLGFFRSGPYFVSEEDPFFVNTTRFPVCIPNPGKTGCSAAYEAWDCRHGRLLLGSRHKAVKKLVVLEPVTGCRRELDAPGPGYYNSCAGAVLCAGVKGCDHRACHAGPSRVVFVGLDTDTVAYAYESLPETGQWSNPCSGLYLGPYAENELLPPVFIQDTLYFKLRYYDEDHQGIHKYDLSSKCLSLIDVPLAAEYYLTILMGMEDGSLGFAHLDGLTLNVWSRHMGSDGVGSWSECTIIDLKELLPVPNKRLRLIGSVPGGDIIFVNTKLGIYEINLKSLEWKKIWKKETFRKLIPYMRFYYPQGRANPCDAAD